MKNFFKNLFKRRRTYRFFLRGGNHFDIKCTNLKYSIDQDNGLFKSYKLDGHDRFFDFLLKELIAITEVK